MDVGADLRNARIARKRSIEDIAQATKITPALLRAIENDAFDRVPGGLFARGYLRAYAREVGLDGETLVQRYRAEFEPVAPVPDSELPEMSERERERLGWLRQAVPVDDDEAGRTKKVLIELCVVLLAVTVYFVGWKRPAPASRPPLQSNTPVDVTPTDAPVAAVAKAVASTGAADADGTPTMDIHPRGDCWVEVTSGGERTVSRLMRDGDHERVTIRGDVRIRVGDPGTFVFTIEGAEGRTVGTAGQPATIRINARNYREFLAH
jgi:cytoskeletal protein RodZ